MTRSNVGAPFSKSDTLDHGGIAGAHGGGAGLACSLLHCRHVDGVIELTRQLTGRGLEVA
jgi:hypothetical protein